VGFGLTKQDLTGEVQVSFSLSPRVGYLIPLSSSLSFWPQIRRAWEVGTSTWENYSEWTAGAAAPLVVELAPHFFVGAGPDFEFSKVQFKDGSDFAFASKGLTTMLGGWI
jgi:hypothetical protein